MPTHSMRFALLTLLLLLCAGCRAAELASKHITFSLEQTAQGLSVSFRDTSVPKAIFRTQPGGLALVANKETHTVAKLDGEVPQAGGRARYVCSTDSGKSVALAVEIVDTHAKLDVSPMGWKADEVRIACESTPDEDFFGGGEVWNGSVSQRGRKIEFWVGEGTPDRCCYVPFFFSTNGYGVYVDSYERGSFSFEPSGARLSFRTTDSGHLPLHFITGPHPRSIVSNYTSITGRPPLPPKWSFLPWKWRDEHSGWDQVFEDAEGMRKHDIPCSVQWIDRPWMEHGLCYFGFDPVRFPDARARIGQLRAMGYRVVVWVAPFTTPAAPNYSIAVDKGYLVKDKAGKPYNLGEGYYIDLTNPDAYAWWKEEMKTVIRLGIEGFKLDRGQRIPQDAVFSDGSTGASMHNRYALLYCRVCYDALKEELGEGSFTMLPRPGCAGSQACSPAKWPGDLAPSFSLKSGLASAIPAGLSIGLSGFPFWGSDIGGFERGGPDTKLLLRWAQFGCFSPIMELGGQDPHEPWNPVFGKEALPVYRYYATLHSELLPYTYSYAVEAHETGLPIMRPLVLEFPEDREACGQSFEFLYGEHFLVAPIYTEQDSRDVYLPAGEWVDYWDWNKVRKGPATITDIHCPLERMPLYLKNGCIVPMHVTNSATGHGHAYSEGKLTLLVLPSGRSHLSLRDVGHTADLWAAEDKREIRVSWKNTRQPVLLRVRSERPTRVGSSSGKAYSRIAGAAAYTGQPGTWCWDEVLLISPRPGDTGVKIMR